MESREGGEAEGENDDLTRQPRPLGSTGHLRELFNIRVAGVRGVMIKVLCGEFLKAVMFVDERANV